MEKGGMMKFIFAIVALLSLSACASPLTRLLPKLEKLDPPQELMVPPKELKTINKPEQPPAGNGKQLDELIKENLNEPPAGK